MKRKNQPSRKNQRRLRALEFWKDQLTSKRSSKTKSSKDYITAQIQILVDKTTATS